MLVSRKIQQLVVVNKLSRQENLELQYSGMVNHIFNIQVFHGDTWNDTVLLHELLVSSHLSFLYNTTCTSILLDTDFFFFYLQV